jgi:heme oxygenase (biliverdin-IX-beta and delta-forming)
MLTAASPPQVRKYMKRGEHATRHSLRSYLRAATGDDHAGLDARLSALDWGSVHDYRRFLEASAAALLPIEAALSDANVIRIFPDWERRTRGPAILRDLECIGGFVPQLGEQPRLSFEGVLGTMYVLEGSRLGSKVLLARIVEAANPTILGATAYLSHGSGQKLWQTFVDKLEQHATQIERAAVASAARRTFRLFALMFARVERSE